jgi:hypothetical protein
MSRRRLFLVAVLLASRPSVTALAEEAAAPPPATADKRPQLADTVFHFDGTAAAFNDLLGRAAEACDQGKVNFQFNIPNDACRGFVASFDARKTLDAITAAYVETYSEAELEDSAKFLDSPPLRSLREGMPKLQSAMAGIAAALQKKAAELTKDGAPTAPDETVAAKPAEPWVWTILASSGIKDRAAMKALLLDRARPPQAGPDWPSAYPAVNVAAERALDDIQDATAKTFGADGPAIAGALDSEDRRRVEGRREKVKPKLDAIAQQFLKDLEKHLKAKAFEFEGKRLDEQNEQHDPRLQDLDEDNE